MRQLLAEVDTAVFEEHICRHYGAEIFFSSNALALVNFLLVTKFATKLAASARLFNDGLLTLKAGFMSQCGDRLFCERDRPQESVW